MSLVGFKAKNHPQQVRKRGATDRDDLGTDPALFVALNERFRFTLDVCATEANAKCERYFTPEDDGLSVPWGRERVWCNPPYSAIGLWVAKALLEFRWNPFSSRPNPIVMLLPANRTEQAWWQDMVEPALRTRDPNFHVEFLRGRQRFVLPGAESIGPNERPPFGCCLLIWGAR